MWLALGRALPNLERISDSSYTNVLCETVIMHLAPEEISAAVERLHPILVLLGFFV
jgi:hypothetical protein